jgi:hypothetical protein
MRTHITKSYLDMARSVINTSIHGDREQTAGDDALFSLMSCTYVFSFMALQSFCASHLHKFWSEENSALRKQHPELVSFEALMAGPLKEVKKALNELCSQLHVEPLHKAKPRVWRELNELLKGDRDYFVHPNPDSFHEHIEATGNREWGFPSRVAAEIMAYFFEATRQPVPRWLKESGLRSKGFEVVCI